MRRAAPPVLHDPQAGTPRPPQRTIQHVCGGLGHPLAGHAAVGAAGFSLRARGLKPTALFSAAVVAS